MCQHVPFSKLLLLFVGCLTSQQQASVSQGRICSVKFTWCHNGIEVADQTFYLTQSQYTYTGPTSPSADPTTPGALQGSHRSANFCVTAMTRPRKKPVGSGIRTPDLSLSRRDALTTRPSSRSFSEQIRPRDRLCILLLRKAPGNNIPFLFCRGSFIMPHFGAAECEIKGPYCIDLFYCSIRHFAFFSVFVLNLFLGTHWLRTLFVNEFTNSQLVTTGATARQRLFYAL